MPKSLVLEVTPPPLRSLSEREALNRIDSAVREQEAKARARIRSDGRKFLGAAAVTRQNPFASPTTREPRRELSPRVATRSRWLREEIIARCGDFARAYREALAAWREKRRDIVFPVGTYLMRIHHQVCCADF